MASSSPSSSSSSSSAGEGGDYPPSKKGKELDAFAQKLFGKLIETTKLSNTLPSGEDHQYLASFGPFSSSASHLSNRLLSLSQQFLSVASAKQETTSEGADVDLLDTEDVEDVLDLYENGVVSKLDDLYELVDTFIDDGIEDPTEVTPTSSSVLKFEDVLDNAAERPFVPKLFYKPNAVRSLADSIVPASTDTSAAVSASSPAADSVKHYARNTLGLSVSRSAGEGDVHVPQRRARRREGGGSGAHDEDDGNGGGPLVYYPNPYAYELEHFEYTKKQLSKQSEQLYGTLQHTKCTWVDTVEKLQEMVSALEAVDLFAVDLENHDYRSYQGFVCLMQVSTRKEDFLVDVLKLRSSMHTLNEVFTNPNTVKVLHGSDSDIVWLQRCFGLYIVNLFDTGQAMYVIVVAQHSHPPTLPPHYTFSWTHPHARVYESHDSPPTAADSGTACRFSPPPRVTGAEVVAVVVVVAVERERVIPAALAMLGRTGGGEVSI